MCLDRVLMWGSEMESARIGFKAVRRMDTQKGRLYWPMWCWGRHTNVFWHDAGSGFRGIPVGCGWAAADSWFSQDWDWAKNQLDYEGAAVEYPMGVHAWADIGPAQRQVADNPYDLVVVRVLLRGPVCQGVQETVWNFEFIPGKRIWSDTVLVYRECVILDEPIPEDQFRRISC